MCFLEGAANTECKHENVLGPWEVFSTVGGYHEYRGGISWVPWGCSVPWGYHDKCGGISWVPWGCSVLWGTQITKDFSPHGTEHPHRTHDIPHVHYDIPHGTEHPHGTQGNSPRYSWYPPTVLNTPHGTKHPHSTAHTLYRVVMFEDMKKKSDEVCHWGRNVNWTN